MERCGLHRSRSAPPQSGAHGSTTSIRLKRFRLKKVSLPPADDPHQLLVKAGNRFDVVAKAPTHDETA